MSYHYGYFLKLDSIRTYAHGFMVLIISFAKISNLVYEIRRASWTACIVYHDMRSPSQPQATGPTPLAPNACEAADI